MGLNAQPSRAELLLAYLGEIRAANRAIRPGRWDCAMFAGEWVQRCTGRDLITPWQRSYLDFQTGFELLSNEGFLSLSDLAAHHLDAVPDVHQAQPGDIVIVATNEVPAFGIFGGVQIHVLALLGSSLRGLDAVPLSQALQVFRP